jgi:acetoin utilization deacetylase AcuC-like enzyme
MAKFGRLYEILVRDGVGAPDQFHCAEPAMAELLTLAHDPAYVDSYLTGTIEARAMRRIGFPWDTRLVGRTCIALAGTVLAAELALQHGLACSTAGGTHHAYYDFGSGYCIFNDLAVAARAMQKQGRTRRVLIVDLDVHQGDGTASILQEDLAVFTFSMHCEANFPFRKQASNLDVALPVGMEDDAYLRTLAQHLPELLTEVRPDLVLYDAGVDPHRDDLLGKLALSDTGLYRRDQYVLATCLAAGTPVACVIGGGYSHDIDALARRHSLVHRAATEIITRI